VIKRGSSNNACVWQSGCVWLLWHHEDCITDECMAGQKCDQQQGVLRCRLPVVSNTVSLMAANAIPLYGIQRIIRQQQWCILAVCDDKGQCCLMPSAAAEGVGTFYWQPSRQFMAFSNQSNAEAFRRAAVYCYWAKPAWAAQPACCRAKHGTTISCWIVCPAHRRFVMVRAVMLRLNDCMVHGGSMLAEGSSAWWITGERQC
jgi:hypothetical protein